MQNLLDGIFILIAKKMFWYIQIGSVLLSSGFFYYQNKFFELEQNTITSLANAIFESTISCIALLFAVTTLLISFNKDLNNKIISKLGEKLKKDLYEAMQNSQSIILWYPTFQLLITLIISLLLMFFNPLLSNFIGFTLLNYLFLCVAFSIIFLAATIYFVFKTLSSE